MTHSAITCHFLTLKPGVQMPTSSVNIYGGTHTDSPIIRAAVFTSAVQKGQAAVGNGRRREEMERHLVGAYQILRISRLRRLSLLGWNLTGVRQVARRFALRKHITADGVLW